MAALPESAGLVIGRYVLYDEIAAGGMATVHFGKLLGAAGFARTVAIKRLHAQHARDADFTTMFLDEARLAARIRHPNVVAVLDVLHQQGELFLVMDYVQGESFSRLMRAVRPSIVPTRIALSIMTGVLNGLHAAHEATTESGEPLSIVHRDVSPQNIMVGTDGVARVLDFGVAKAANRAQTTREGTVKGKLSYMAPEQLLTEAVDRRADVYAAAVVLWEALTGERLFEGDNQGRVVRKILDEPVPTPSSRVPGFTKALDDAVMRGLERDVTKRFATAREFATALERCMPMATSTEIGEWVESIGGSALGERAKRVKEIESRSDIQPPISQARTVSNYPTRTDLEKPEAKAVRETVPQAFAVMATPMDLKQPTDPDISPPSSGHASGTQKA
ncbi:MAG TPA: serine/threonine-protein kinase, partial [Labilithrix sp.]